MKIVLSILILSGLNCLGAANSIPSAVEPQVSSPDQAETLLFSRQESISIAPGGSGSAPVRIPLLCRLDKGQSYVLRFQLRALGKNGAEDANAGQSGLIVRVGTPNPDEPSQDRLSPSLMESITLASGEWQDIAVPFKARDSLDESQAVVQFSPAYFQQPAQVRELTIHSLPAGVDGVRYGKAYAGQELDADWRTEANRRILKNRTGALAVKVVDALGRPVEGAVVEIEMIRHAYLFGTAAVASRLIDAPLFERREDIDQAVFLKDNKRYRAELDRLFNFVVFENDMKWSFWLNENKTFDQSWTDDALNELRAGGFKIKGHTMVWGSWKNVPKFLRQLETQPDALQNAIVSHIRDLGDATRDRVEYFDVLNEPMSHYELIDLLGHDAVAEWFQTARKALPNTKLIVNDFDLIGNGGSPARREKFIDFVRDIRERGAPVDLVGFQSHFWSPRLTAPEEIWRILDQFHDELGLPMMVSEFDMNILDEALQADYTRDFLTAWFAHPSTEAFIMWGFWGGAHWMRDAGAMYRRDWTEKPNLKAYTDLVFGEWWTEESLRSGVDGRVCVPNGFFGDYRIRVTTPDGRTTLERSWRHEGAQEDLTVQLLPVL